MKDGGKSGAVRELRKLPRRRADAFVFVPGYVTYVGFDWIVLGVLF